MSKIDKYTKKKNEGKVDEYKSANWGGVKVQLVTRGVLQAAQLANFAKLLRISNDMEQVSLPGIFNLLMRAFPNDKKKQDAIRHAFIKSFGSDSVVGDQGKESYDGIKEEDLATIREMEGDPSATDRLTSAIDHIVRSAALIKSATVSGIYDADSVITSLNTLMGDINKVVSLLSDQGEPQPAPGEEQPGGEERPEESKKPADEMGIPNEMKDFIHATAKKYGMRCTPGLGGCMDFEPPFRNHPSLAQRMDRNGNVINMMQTGFSGEVGMKEAGHFVTAINNALKALQEIQTKYPANVMP